MASHTMKRTMVTSGRLTISTNEPIIERIGITGTHGTRAGGWAEFAAGSAHQPRPAQTRPACQCWSALPPRQLASGRPRERQLYQRSGSTGTECESAGGSVRRVVAGDHHVPSRRRCGSAHRAEQSTRSSGRRVTPVICYNR